MVRASDAIQHRRMRWSYALCVPALVAANIGINWQARLYAVAWDTVSLAGDSLARVAISFVARNYMNATDRRAESHAPCARQQHQQQPAPSFVILASVAVSWPRYKVLWRRSWRCLRVQVVHAPRALLSGCSRSAMRVSHVCARLQTGERVNKSKLRPTTRRRARAYDDQQRIISARIVARSHFISFSSNQHWRARPQVCVACRWRT